jgi:mannose-1-phosphate guanylyltransferase/mannose-6-phosphate isomerase
MSQARGRIIPVILSGGTGSRLWPLSREACPKQLLSLLDEKTLLQQTALRVGDPSLFANPMVIANMEHRFAIGEQLRGVGISDPTIVLEPFGRNTAPAVTVAALLASEADPDAVILVMPADHWVSDRSAFRSAISAGLKAAQRGRFVLFGLRPTASETRFGYIQRGGEFADVPGVHDVVGFVEKPDRAAVEQLLADNEHLWNSGIFLLPARPFIDELKLQAPDVLAACRESLATATRDLDFLRLGESGFAECPLISIDYAVMEKTDRAVVVMAPFDWSDVGSWSALWKMGDKDREGNVVVGDVVLEDTSGCYVRGEGPLVAALGVDDLVITATPDVVLVAARNRDQASAIWSNGSRAMATAPRPRRSMCTGRGGITNRSTPVIDSRSNASPSIPAPNYRCRSTSIVLSIGWWSMEPPSSPATTRRFCCVRTNRCSSRWAACIGLKIRERCPSI